jgi:hypothetical protein
LKFLPPKNGTPEVLSCQDDRLFDHESRLPNLWCELETACPTHSPPLGRLSGTVMTP